MTLTTKKLYICSISILLALISFPGKSEKVTFSKYDLLLFGGGDFNYVKNAYITDNYARINLKVGGEFLVFENLSVGVSLNNELNVFLFLNEMYTSCNVSLINKNLYYLKGEYIHHYKRDDNWKYPDSYREHGFAIGIGKKIFLNRYILFDILLGAQYYEAKWMDAQEQICRKETIQFSITTGFLIYFKLKN